MQPEMSENVELTTWKDSNRMRLLAAASNAGPKAWLEQQPRTPRAESADEHSCGRPLLCQAAEVLCTCCSTGAPSGKATRKPTAAGLALLMLPPCSPSELAPSASDGRPSLPRLRNSSSSMLSGSHSSSPLPMLHPDSLCFSPKSARNKALCIDANRETENAAEAWL